jgi:multiple sugar transport system permease protein
MSGSGVTERSDRGGSGPEGGASDGGRTSRRYLSDRGLGRVFVTPSIVTMAFVAAFPILYAVFLSLYEYSRRTRLDFTGVGNYVEAVTDIRFWHAVEFTFFFTVTSVGLEFLIGLGFALIMNQAFKGRGVTRAIILIPWIIPTVIAAQMWFFMFNVTPGFINWSLGLGNFHWLGSMWPARFAIVFADVWKTAPFVALLLLAGLQTIPQDLYESAQVDGASVWQRFWNITLPLLKPAILVALLFRTVDALRIFDLAEVMTRGAFRTETLSILVQRWVLRHPDPGYGSALSTLTFIIVLGVGMVFVRFLGRELVIGTEEEK